MTRRQADALVAFLHRRQRRYHAEALRMGGGIHTWVLLTDREGGTCPPPFADVTDFLAAGRGSYVVAPDCRRLLGEWLRGEDAPPQTSGAAAAPARRRLAGYDEDSRFFSALVAAALRYHRRAAACHESGDRSSAERHHDDARRTARKGLRLLRRLRLRDARHDDGLPGLERTGAAADTAPRRRF